MKNRTIPITIVFALLIFLRFISERSENLTIFVSILNLIALLTVLVSIIEQIRIDVTNKIKKLGIPKEIINREVRCFTIKINICSYIPFSFFIIIYLLFFSSTLGNDILSIISLGLSLTSSNIAESIIKILTMRCYYEKNIGTY